MNYKIVSLPEDIADNLEKALLKGLIALKHDFANTDTVIDQKLILGAEYILVNFLNDLKNGQILKEPEKKVEQENPVEDDTKIDGIDVSLFIPLFNEAVKELGLIFKGMQNSDICFAFKKRPKLTQQQLQDVADSAHRLLVDSNIPEIENLMKIKKVRIV